VRATGYQTEQKSRNVSNLLKLINRSQNISRIQAAKILELDRSTVSGIVSELIEKGILIELPLAEKSGKGGRPPIMLQINKDFGVVIGIEIHLTSYQVIVMNLHGEEVYREADSIVYEEHKFAETCIALLRKVEQQVSTLGCPLLGAVFAISGNVNPQNKILTRSFAYHLENYDFHHAVGRHFSYPVFLENDSNCCAFGELYPPWETHSSSFLYLLARTTDYNPATGMSSGMGIGIGVVSEGQLIYGAHNISGELYSVFWKRQTRGNQVGIPLERLLTINEDEQVLREFIEEILINMGAIISVLDPEAIIFGGDLKEHIPLIHEVIEQRLADYYIAEAIKDCQILPPSKGEQEIAAGAACLLLSHLFSTNLSCPEPFQEELAWEKTFERLHV